MVAAGVAAPGPKPKRRGRLALVLVLGVVLAGLVSRIFFQAFKFEGSSMMPALAHGDRFLVNKIAFGVFLPFASSAAVSWGMPDAGDIVVLRSPEGDIDIVKRVIGLPGDTIEVRDDLVIRNGTPLPTRDAGPCEGPAHLPGDACQWMEETIDDRSYITSRNSPSSSPPHRVPEGHVYVLGDYRDHSNDSRFLGPVPADRIKGRAVWIYWSDVPSHKGQFL